MNYQDNISLFSNGVISIGPNYITHQFTASILRDLFLRQNALVSVNDDHRLQAFSFSSTCKVAAGSRTSIVCYGTDPGVLLAHMVHHVSMAKKQLCGILVVSNKSR